MTEFRIYYECLEQALHFLKPMLEDALRKNDIRANIRLVRRAQLAPAGTGLGAVLSLATPDALLTAVDSGEEIPLVLVEFSEAVFAEDHELQRSYGVCAACFAEMFYVKIAGLKRSTKEFGGAECDPLMIPRVLADNFGYHGCVHATWGVAGESGQMLAGDDKYLSCPPDIPLVRDVVSEAVKGVAQGAVGWYSRALGGLNESRAYCEYRRKVERAKSGQALLDDWRERERRNVNKARRRFFVRSGSVTAKINRFSHAMDPDRGVLIFMSMAFSNSRDILGFYALERQKTEGMKTPITGVDELRQRVRAALSKDKGGIPVWLSESIVRAADESPEMGSTVNFQPVWEANMDALKNNRVAAALMCFLDGLRLSHNGPLLKWDRRRLLKCAGNESILDALKRVLGFGAPFAPAPLRNVGDETNEDEVTYALVHRFLRPNGFRLVAVSYPGAQGGTALLPRPDKGKSQPREYPDVIALLPGDDVRVALNESKGRFSKAALTADIRKLADYKREGTGKRAALARALIEAERLDNDGQIRRVLIGVSFGGEAGGSTKTSWRPEEVDFVFMLPTRARWKIGLFDRDLANAVCGAFEGDTGLPETYKVDGKNNP